MNKLYLKGIILLLCLGSLLFSGDNVSSQAQKKIPCINDSSLLLDSSNKPIWFSDKELRQRIKSSVDPKFPKACKCKGEVLIDVLIDAEGKVSCFRMRKGHPLLQASVAQAVKQWTFEPMVKNGKPFAIVGRLVFYFRDSQLIKTFQSQ